MCFQSTQRKDLAFLKQHVLTGRLNCEVLVGLCSAPGALSQRKLGAGPGRQPTVTYRSWESGGHIVGPAVSQAWTLTPFKKNHLFLCHN